MKKKDRENEYIGIISVLVTVILALILIYYFYFSHTAISDVPVEAPALQTEQTGSTP